MVAKWPSKPTRSKKLEMKNKDNVSWSPIYYYPCKDRYDYQGGQENGWLGLWYWFHGYIRINNKPQRDAKNLSNWGPKHFWGFSRVPLLDATFVIPQKLLCLRYPNGIISRCFISILPDFLGLHSCPCKASDKFIQLEWVGLQGHFSTKLYQNLTVTERSVVNTKYQLLSQETMLLLLLSPQIDLLWVIQVLRSFLDITS